MGPYYDSISLMIERLPEQAPQGQWIKIIAPDGELSREADNLVYNVSKSGRKKIETYVVLQ